MIGLLPVDKPEGPTSHDIVARARRATGVRRIGHTGTLDPFASGLLLLCIGPATRLAEYLHPLPKTYVGVARLGQATDTDDRTGDVVGRSEAWRELDETAVRAAFTDQQGERMQVPPAYSAKKVDGQRLYRRARRGETVVAEAAPVEIHRLVVRRLALPDVEFEVECSTGTYIRAIARDAGAQLGVGAHLTELRRTRIGPFDAASALDPERLDREHVLQALVPPLAALAHVPRVDVDGDDARRIRNGGTVARPGVLGLLVVAHAGALVAVAEGDGQRVHPRKVFHDA
ncbi:MAG TPA: tRNA pseudouridine(55) synthase TruB [Longimicrobiales bacterium]|nr:tRNA pseudouridine(55) synthase TruB [Longimicrobiales bacterium]